MLFYIFAKGAKEYCFLVFAIQLYTSCADFSRLFVKLIRSISVFSVSIINVVHVIRNIIIAESCS